MSRGLRHGLKAARWAIAREFVEEVASTSRVENRRSGFSLPVAVGVLSQGPPQSGLAWFYFLFPLIEPDRQISRIRLSEKTHAF